MENNNNSNIEQLLIQLIEQSRRQHEELISEIRQLRLSLAPKPTDIPPVPQLRPSPINLPFEQIKTEKALIQFEEMLQNPFALEEMFNTLLRIKDLKLVHIITPNLLDEYNYDGIKNKKPLKDLYLFQKLYAPIVESRGKDPVTEVKEELRRVKNRICKKRLSDKKNFENFENYAHFSKMPRLAEDQEDPGFDPLYGQYVPLQVKMEPEESLEKTSNDDINNLNISST